MVNCLWINTGLFHPLNPFILLFLSLVLVFLNKLIEIGLINMLKNLEDSSTIGPNMAVALVTTFYGSLIANWLCAPFANKLKANNELELTLKTLIIEGLLSIQAGENPRVIEEKLKSFLSPDKREALSPEGGGEE